MIINRVRLATFSTIFRHQIELSQAKSPHAPRRAPQEIAGSVEAALERGGAEEINLTPTVLVAMQALGIGGNRRALDAYLSGSDQYA